MQIRPLTSSDESELWAMLKPVFRAGDTYAIDPEISRDDALAYWTGADAGAYLAQDESGVLGTYYIKTNAQGRTWFSTQLLQIGRLPSSR